MEKTKEISGSSKNLSLEKAERETIISWCDEDTKIFIYSSQQSMIRKLLQNPLFECTDKRYNKAYYCYPNPISVEGYLPMNSLTIRKKIRVLSEEERLACARRLQKARESRELPTNSVNSEKL